MAPLPFVRDSQEMKSLSRYIEGLTVGQGRYAGQKVRLFPWEKRFLAGTFAQGDDALLTLGRGNGKTTLTSAIACATVDVGGPLVEPMAENVICASSYEQGLINFRHVCQFLQPSFEKYGTGTRGRFRVQDSIGKAAITDRETGAIVRVLGSDPKRAHGLAPKILLLDEVAQWPRTSVDGMVAALRTSRGKIPGSRMIWLGTRPDSPSHPFEVAAKAAGFVLSFAADKNDDPFKVATWRKANPSLRYMPELMEAIRLEAKAAKDDAALMASFKALRLNMGVSDTANRTMLVSPELWEEICGLQVPERVGAPVWGIDLGGTDAMSAIVAVWANGRMETLAQFGGYPDLDQRARKDGAGTVYRLAHEAGELMVSRKRVPDVAELFEEALSRFGKPSRLVCDRWRLGELEDSLEDSDFGWTGIPLIPRGQGFKDGATSVRAWRKACVDRVIRPVQRRLLTSALAEAVTAHDPAGNEKLAAHLEGGRRLRAKDDVVAAALLGVEFMPDLEEAHGGYHGLV